MLTNIFRILKSYKKVGEMELTCLGDRAALASAADEQVKGERSRCQLSLWPVMIADFDANVEIEFRNQAAAMTDCLLLFKVCGVKHKYMKQRKTKF